MLYSSRAIRIDHHNAVKILKETKVFGDKNHMHAAGRLGNFLKQAVGVHISMPTTDEELQADIMECDR